MLHCRVPSLALCGIALLAGLVGCAPAAPDPAPRWTDADRIGTVPDFYERLPKNLLMISIDTFRRDHLDRYAPEPRTLTPFLSGLANQGFTLDDHTTCSNWTFASVVCTMRGATNVDNGFMPTLSASLARPVPDGAQFLPHWLRPAGFESVLVTSNYWFSEEWGTQGFDEAYDPPFGGARKIYAFGRDRMLDRIEAGADRWYLHLHLMEPHAAYHPPPAYLTELADLPPVPWDLVDRGTHYDLRDEYPTLPPEQQALLEQHLRIRYQAEIRWTDDLVREMFVDLQRRGLLDDTLVVLWSDHGEAFWEHGFHTHAYTLHREENDGFVIFWANNMVPGSWSGPTSAIDLVPTLLSLYGIERPPEVTGLPVGEAPPDRPRFATAVARLGVVQMVRKGHHKLMTSWSGLARFYDLQADPHEQDDRFDPDDPVVQELWEHLRPYAEATEPLAPQAIRQDPPGL